METILLVTCLALSLSQASLLLVFGPKTPTIIMEASFNFPLFNISYLFEPSIEELLLEASFIVDATLDRSFIMMIDSISSIFNIPYISFTRPLTSEKSFYRFHAFQSIPSEVEAISKMINYLKWENFTIFSSYSVENMLSIDLLHQKINRYRIRNCIYESQITEENLDKLVKKYLKINQDHNLLVLDQGDSLNYLVNLLKNRKIGKHGKYFLFGPSSHYAVDIEGSLSLVYPYGKNAKSSEEIFLEVLSNLEKNQNLTNRENLLKLCPDQFCFSELLISNQRNNENKIVGSVGMSVFINEEIVFPGNNTKIQTGFVKEVLEIMIANGTKEPNEISNEVTSRFYYGALYAAELENSKEDRFEYRLIQTDCGNLMFNISWSIECLSRFLNTKSIAYLTGYWTQSAFTNLLAFKAFNRFLPQISPDGQADILNNKTYYPEYLKLSGRLNEFSENSIFLFLFYNWKKISFIVSQDELSVQGFEYTSKIMERMGISIINSEEYRYLPSNYTRDDFEKYKHIFQHIKDSRCRVVLMLVADSGLIYEAFYDIGLRKGDLVFITYGNIYFDLYEKIEEKYLLKRKEVVNGALVSSLIQYEGEIGKEIERGLKRKYQSALNMGLSFDAFKTISNSVKYLMSKGEDYEDPYILMNAMRNGKFTGCSGKVNFIPGENSRDKAWNAICQIIIGTKTKQVDVMMISALNKFAVIASKEINKPIWPTGEKTVPSNFRPYQVCVYKSEPEISFYGKLSLHIISLIFLILVIISAFLSFKKFDCPVIPFTEKVQISFNDIIHQLFMVCELFQILSLEPQDGLLVKSTKGLNFKLGLDFLRIFDLHFNDFWTFYTTLLVLTGSWVVLTALSIIVKIENLQKFEIMFFFKFLSESVLSVVGHLGFMPLTLMLLSIYKCEEGVSDDLFDSFISNDCTQYCYRDKHRLVAVASSFIIASFLAVSVYFRPYWELSRNDQHVRTKVSYFSLLSVFQFILVLLRINLEKTQKVVQVFLIAGLAAFFATLTAKMQPFNYGKSNVIQILVLTLSAWNMAVTGVFLLFPFDKQLGVVLFVGHGLIFCAGYKKASQFPSQFIADHSQAIPTLIKFQFSQKAKNDDKNNTFYRNLEKKIIIQDSH